MTDTMTRFWDLFVDRAPALAVADSTDSPAYRELSETLKDVHDGLYLEFSVDGGECELIITADGDATLFPVVHMLVSRAPDVDGWAVLALKPRLGFPKTVRWQNLTLATATIVFDPLERAGSSDLGLRIFVPGIEPHQVEDAHNAVLRAIDHGLGEEEHAKHVKYSEVRPLETAPGPVSAIPLVELDAFIRWCSARQRSDS